MPRFDPTRLRLPGGSGADLLLVSAVLVLAGVAEGQRLGPDGHATPSLIASWLLVMALCGALLLRRRHPVAVGWCTVVGTGLYYLLSTVDGPLVLVPIAALYPLASQGRLRAAVAMATVMVIGVGAGALSGTSDVNGTAVFMLTGWLIAILALGAMRHGRAAHIEEEARLRATQERLRIARELHDVIGHNMSMINVQASAALHRLKKDPGQAEGALAAIKESSKEGLRELRTTLGVLRQVDEEAPTVPTPGLARIDDLIASAERAGLQVRLESNEPRTHLPAAVDLAAYRIVQEALTNAVKHGGAGHVTIRLAYEEEQVTLWVEDDGRGAPAGRTAARGSGIGGMTERARALGGTLAVRQGAHGGFVVHARLPCPDHDEPTLRSDR
ncbi:sensor histidine kinase [Streptomyces sp. HD]|uniref:sensor histidine kinase n=1 Tax=Streptomyces sp. HD TaxID=3020892 RepID=UPI0023304800|nr:sensor histidine kinase [Streptomyces sp. HD]MDC0773526.1 sensor histidine kinase [Streptomyces sp. HD]